MSKTPLMILAGLAALTGCMKSTAPVAPTSHAPLVVDEAMQKRTWPVTAAKFANGETVGWPTGFMFDHNPSSPPWTRAVTGTPLFMVNVFAMPVAYTFNPPWTQVIYPFGVIEPSYNAMPPQPPANR